MNQAQSSGESESLAAKTKAAVAAVNPLRQYATRKSLRGRATKTSVTSVGSTSRPRHGVGLESVLAGYVAGSCGLLIGHPLDSLKVLLQTSALTTTTTASTSSAQAYTGSARAGAPASSASSATAAVTVTSNVSASTGAGSQQQATLPNAMQKRGKGSVSAPHLPSSVHASSQPGGGNMFKISGHHGRGLRSLYAGISVPLATIGVIQSANFFIYDSLRQYLHKRDELSIHLDTHDPYVNTVLPSKNYLYHDSLTNVALASGVAGLAISAATSPLMVLKTKQQIHAWSLRQAASHTLLRPGGGVRSLFVGFMPHAFCESFGRTIYFTTYEYLKRQVASSRDASSHFGGSSANLGTPQRMGCAALAGMLCWTLIYPLDVLRSRAYHAQAGAVSSSSTKVPGGKTTMDMARELWNAGGGSPRGFYRGLTITVARAGPVAAVVLPVYDATLEWLKA